jgi:HTH-type transcriptional regulator, quorum sensing regulator NprR
MSPGKLIKYHRKREGITQKDLAKGICSISYLSKLENDSIEPNAEVLNLLGGKLNITFDQKQEDDEKNKRQIYSWYNTIKDRNEKKAREELRILRAKCERSGSLEINHLFKVFYFCFEITFNRFSSSLKNTYEELKGMQSLFQNEALYYFYKFESLYYFYEGNINLALESLKEGEKVHNRLDFIDLDLHYNLTIFYRRTYQIHKSTIHAYKLLQEAQIELDYSVITDANLIIVANNIRIGEYDSAEEILLKLKRQTQNHTPKTNHLIFHNLGYIYFQKNEYEQSIKYLDKALTFMKEQHENIGTIYVKALVNYHFNYMQEAKDCIEIGKSVAATYDRKKFIHKFFILEQKLESNLLSDSFIEKMEKEIIPFFKETGEQHELMRHIKLLGDIYYDKRQYKKAAECLSQTHELYTNVFKIEDFV